MSTEKSKESVIWFKTSMLWSGEESPIDKLTRYMNGLEYKFVENPKMPYSRVYLELDDGTIYSITTGTLFVNMACWIANVHFGVKIEKDSLYNFDDLNSGKFASIMNDIISKFIHKGYDFDSYNIIGEIKQRIIRTSNNHAVFMCNTFSLYDILAFESRCPKFAQIFNHTIDPNKMTVSEAQAYLNAAKEEVYNIVMEDKMSSIYPYVSTRILNTIQMGQMFAGVGPQSDIDKTIMPIIIKRNWIQGLIDLSEFFVSAISNRNAVIVKKDSVPDAGYLSRKVTMACLKTKASVRFYNCGTTHYLDFNVATKDHLDMIAGKYMLVDPKGPIVTDVKKTDTHLIGVDIKLRSHTKCITGHTVKTVCAICLGDKHKSLKNSRIGGFVSIRLVNRLSQLAMSAKHAAETKSEDISSKFIDSYFNINKSDIFIKQFDDVAMRNKYILLPLDSVTDIIASDAVSEDGVESGVDFSKQLDTILVVENGRVSGINLMNMQYFIHMSNSLIKQVGNNLGSVVKLSEMVDVFGNLEVCGDVDSEDTVIQDDEYVCIKFKDIDPVEPVFVTRILTEEVSRYLSITRSIIDGAGTAKYTSPEEMINDLLNVVFDSGIKRDGLFIHIETLVANLMRDKYDVLKSPDFKVYEPEIQFIKLQKCVKSSDLFSGIAFEDLKRSIESCDMLYKKEVGIYDALFRTSQMFINGERFKKERAYLFADYNRMKLD